MKFKSILLSILGLVIIISLLLYFLRFEATGPSCNRNKDYTPFRDKIVSEFNKELVEVELSNFSVHHGVECQVEFEFLFQASSNFSELGVPVQLDYIHFSPNSEVQNQIIGQIAQIKEQVSLIEKKDITKLFLQKVTRPYYLIYPEHADTIYIKSRDSYDILAFNPYYQTVKFLDLHNKSLQRNFTQFIPLSMNLTKVYAYIDLGSHYISYDPSELIIYYLNVDKRMVIDLEKQQITSYVLSQTNFSQEFTEFNLAKELLIPRLNGELAGCRFSDFFGCQIYNINGTDFNAKMFLECPQEPYVHSVSFRVVNRQLEGLTINRWRN